MYVNVAYELVGYQNLHYFTMGGKQFVMVDILIDTKDGLKDVPHQTYLEDKWWEILDSKTVYFHECVPQNIMIGDYYN